MSGTDAHVAILLATHNGARFIDEQLASIAAQSHRNWSLWVGDDESTDATIDRIMAFRRAHPDRTMHLRRGPGRGVTANFLSLICNQKVTADYIAFCDQDDVWLPGKLARALDMIGTCEGPALYGARTILTDARLRVTGLSPDFREPPCFGNALVQNMAGGNTMVMNAAARDLIMRAGLQIAPVCHDWWAYQIVTGAGGRFIFDRRPALLYRQHGGNLIGANSGTAARLSRLRALWRGVLRDWNGRNLAALRASALLLRDDHRETLARFEVLRLTAGPRALGLLAKAGLTRQTRAGTLALQLAAVTGRL
jgi:glycosyltransferase involved in cell wall biosynthesis